MPLSTTNDSLAAGGADLIIEAIPERVEMKEALLRKNIRDF